LDSQTDGLKGGRKGESFPSSEKSNRKMDEEGKGETTKKRGARKKRDCCDKVLKRELIQRKDIESKNKERI